MNSEDIPPRGPGILLASARIRHGLALAEIAARTRVPRHQLEALEAED